MLFLYNICPFLRHNINFILKWQEMEDLFHMLFSCLHCGMQHMSLYIFILLNILMPGSLLWQRHVRAHKCVTKVAWYSVTYRKWILCCCYSMLWYFLVEDELVWTKFVPGNMLLNYTYVVMRSWSTSEVHILSRHMLHLYRNNNDS